MRRVIIDTIEFQYRPQGNAILIVYPGNIAELVPRTSFNVEAGELIRPRHIRGYIRKNFRKSWRD